MSEVTHMHTYPKWLAFLAITHAIIPKTHMNHVTDQCHFTFQSSDSHSHSNNKNVVSY